MIIIMPSYRRANKTGKLHREDGPVIEYINGYKYWYINDKFFKASSANEKQFFVPDEGLVKISCTDDKGRNRNIRIRVKYVDL